MTNNINMGCTFKLETNIWMGTNTKIGDYHSKKDGRMDNHLFIFKIFYILIISYQGYHFDHSCFEFYNCKVWLFRLLVYWNFGRRHSPPEWTALLFNSQGYEERIWTLVFLIPSTMIEVWVLCFVFIVKNPNTQNY